MKPFQAGARTLVPVGARLFRAEDRTAASHVLVIDRDADRIPVSLLKGQNVLVMKVINEVNDWGACARFMRGESVVTNLKVTLTPQ